MPFTERPPDLHAYRDDSTEVQPGETITNWRGADTVFYATTRANDASRDGKIQVDSPFGTEHYAACYGLYVAVAARAQAVPAPVPYDAEATSCDMCGGPLVAGEGDGRMCGSCTDAEDGEPVTRTSAEEMGAEVERLARTTAPPTPGITRNVGYTVYAVLPAGRDAWYVAAVNDQLNHATWLAEAASDGSRTLCYTGGHHHTHGVGVQIEALADLAERAGIFAQLTDLTAGMVCRGRWQESHDAALSKLTDRFGVGRAKARAGMDEATALGHAIITWHSHGRQTGYAIRYDRYACTYSVSPL